MSRVHLVLLFLFFVFKEGTLSDNQKYLKKVFPIGKIVGGQRITIDQAPWQVSLEDSGYSFCGGSIISENYVLTAAHCIDGTPAEYVQIRSGAQILETGGTLTDISQITQSPNFSSITFDYDIAVLRLAEPLILDVSQRAIKLRKSQTVADEIGEVTGWTINDEDFLISLHAVQIPIMNHRDCKEIYGHSIITDRMLCAGKPGPESCQGDSGSALTINGTQVGIISFGFGCASRNLPGVYTSIASLQNFIDENSNYEAMWEFL